MNKKYTACDFCSHRTASGCSVRPDPYYCRKALDEFYAYLREQKAKKGQKR